MGGDFRAETGRDYASYVARVERDACGEAMGLLADVALRPDVMGAKLPPERAKLLEELRAAEHDADFVLERMFLRSLWKGHGLCRPPRGRFLTVKNQTRLADLKPKKMAKFHEMSHHPEALTIVAAGAIEHKGLLTLAKKQLKGFEMPKKTVSTTEPTEGKFVAIKNRPQFPRVRIMLGFPACAASDDLWPTAGVLNALIRGRLGALSKAGDLNALEVSSELRGYADAGCLIIGLRTERRDGQESYERAIAELKALSNGEVEAAELKRARATRRARISAQLDSPRARAESLAEQERYFGRAVPIAEQLKQISAVSAEDVGRLASRWIQPYTLSVAALGSLQGVRLRPPSSCW